MQGTATAMANPEMYQSVAVVRSSLARCLLPCIATIIKAPPNNNRADAVGLPTVKVEGILRDPDVPKWLTLAIADIHSAAVARVLSEVVLDIHALEYANASAWRCLMGWLHLIHSDPSAHYKLRVISERSYHWQQIGVRTMRILGKDHMVVE